MTRLSTIVTLFMLGAGLEAAPITYTFTGSGTGTLGSTTFTNANFVATLVTDTSSPGPIISQGTIGVLGLPIQINISGVGTETFTGATYIFDLSNALGFGEGNGGLFTAPGDVMQIYNNAFVGYDMVSNLTVSGTNVDYPAFTNAATDGGLLSFSQMSTVTFQASTNGQGTAAPEPGSFFLLLGGIGAIPLLRRIVR